MNKIKKLFFILASLTIIQFPAMAGDGHAHGKKGHKHSEKEVCAECKDKKDCKCEEKKDDYGHKDGDGHDHGKKKKKKSKSTQPVTEKK